MKTSKIIMVGYLTIFLVFTLFQSVGAQNTIVQNSSWQIQNHTPATHLVLIAGDVIKNMELQPGDFLGAFTAEGQCSGIIQIEGIDKNLCLTVYGDDPFTPEKDGFTDGEPILIRQYQTQKGEEKDLLIEFDPTFPNQGFFTSHGVSALKIGQLGIGTIRNTGDLMFNLFPNPTRDMITISWSKENIEPANIYVFNAFGQVVEEFQFGITSAGMQTVSLDVSKLEQGTYFVKINSDQRYGTKKLIIVK